MIVRLDKYLANLWLVSRRSIGSYIKLWKIYINWEIAKKSDLKIKDWDIISFDWKDIEVKDKIYIILNKPKWYISSNIDEFWYKSFRHLIQDCPYVNMMNVAGRLDQDTEWLLLLTNDWDFIHEIISPRHKEEKEYYVELDNLITDEEISNLEQWVELDDGYKTMPAKVKRISEKIIKLIIVEWKYHQDKRMAESVWNKVIYLRRDRIWDWNIDGLELWQWKYLTPTDN